MAPVIRFIPPKQLPRTDRCSNVGSLVILLAFCTSIAAAQQTATQWWQTASFYQIYPRSFKDCDGDGVGDLNGVTEQLPYLKEIGIAATWLSPIFTSPMADFGYDFANFTEIIRYSAQ